MSFFKSVAANSSVFTPREAKMAMRQPSTYRVLSQRAGSSLRKTTSVNLLYFRGSSSVRVFSFLNIARYSSCSGEEFYSSSKRRSRGPVMAAKKASQGQKEEDGRYKHTVDLPKTTFGMRANALVREPEIQKLWDDHQVFKRVVDKNDGGNFVLHDGPPYANGDLHMGHALNKILKDIINRYKRFGVWADWNNPYLTLDPKYEAAQIEVFGEMALKGHIYRGRKPVHWSPSSSTALAEAELEALYLPVKFVLSRLITSILFISLEKELTSLFYFLSAVAVNAKLQYAVVEAKSLSEDVHLSAGNKKKRLGNIVTEPKMPFFIVASNLVPTLEAKWGIKLIVKKTLSGSDLENCRYVHPINNMECPVVIGGDYITTESGTGLVHTAPGHGLEDYVTGLKYGLPIYSPVDDDGKFTEEAGQFNGLDVLGDGNAAVVKYLDEKLSIIMEESYEHKYPYDWRTKKPTIFRATEQWFASVEGFRQAAMDAIGHVKWIPAQAQNRISSMTSSRSDWCISRQRTWGLPIPVFYHVTSREPLMNKETIDHIKSIIAQKGSDAWWHMTVEDLLPEEYRDTASEYEKGTDTMDVWFDSGSSWAAVLGERDCLNFPADLYLEGTDQHRGWFQSSLLTSIATKGKAPYSSVITHGFVLDEKGLKMSKSLGNVVDPHTIIEGGKNQKEAPGYGADIMRLWVSSVDYTGDVMIGPQILRQMSDVYRKLRGTLRYLLGNLHDWKVENAVSYQELPMIDRHALFQLENVVKNIREGYENYQFFKIFQIVQRFVNVDLSNFYFDIAKDRLYVGVIAPILPHLAEDVWQNLPFQYTIKDGSIAGFVFESKWPSVNEKWLAFPAEEVDFWGKVLELRTEVNKVLEIARAGKLIGSSLEAKVYLHVSDASLASRLLEMCSVNNDADALHRIFLTSQVEVVPSLDHELVQNISHTGEYVVEDDRVWIGVSRADGSKCERCWNYSPQVGSFTEHPTLCGRCFNVVGIQPTPAMAAAIS
ncbi:hypothetical protein GOBAR_DD07323 [Gossypium barbadense]|nr:hypothetical protein GOBAR_DD07323 [Gossypium barbadense]